MSQLFLGVQSGALGGVLSGVVAKPPIPSLALLSPINFRVLLSPIDGRILLRAA